MVVLRTPHNARIFSSTLDGIGLTDLSQFAWSIGCSSGLYDAIVQGLDLRSSVRVDGYHCAKIRPIWIGALGVYQNTKNHEGRYRYV